MRQAKAPPPKEAVPDIPIENIADLPAVARLRELLARLTYERDQLKKMMHLTVAWAEARNASAGGRGY